MILTQVTYCQLAGLEKSSSLLHRMYAVLLVKPNDSRLILSNSVQYLEAISPRIYFYWLDPSGPDFR
jgi:hypothetical protein